MKLSATLSTLSLLGMSTGQQILCPSCACTSAAYEKPDSNIFKGNDYWATGNCTSLSAGVAFSVRLNYTIDGQTHSVLSKPEDQANTEISTDKECPDQNWHSVSNYVSDVVFQLAG